MSWIQFVLFIIVFESLVVQVEHEWLRFEVITPMSQSPHYSIEIFIVSVVLASRAIKLLIEISKRPLRLD